MLPDPVLQLFTPGPLLPSVKASFQRLAKLDSEALPATEAAAEERAACFAGQAAEIER